MVSTEEQDRIFIANLGKKHQEAWDDYFSWSHDLMFGENQPTTFSGLACRVVDGSDQEEHF